MRDKITRSLFCRFPIFSLIAIFAAFIFATPLFAKSAAHFQKSNWKLVASKRLTPEKSLIALYAKTVANGERNVQLHLIIASAKNTTLRVIDSPSAKTADLAALMRKNHCLAGVNGGYFKPDRTPLGLVISDGKQIHSRQIAPLISGIVFVANGEVRIVRSRAFHRTKRVTQALQAGPFLIDHGKRVNGLNATKRAIRTVVVSEKNGDFALLNINSTTLAEAAQILASRKVFPKLKIVSALNLDGGTSSGMWVAMKPKPFHLSELKAVRTYLGITSK